MLKTRVKATSSISDILIAILISEDNVRIRLIL